MRTDEASAANGGASSDLDLRGVALSLWRKRRWVVVPTLAAAVLSLAAVTLMTPRYKSESRILIEGRESVFLRPEAEKLGDRERGVVDAETVQSQVQVILSKDLASQVIKQLKLGERAEFDPVLNGFAPLRFVLSALGLGRDALTMTPEERVLEAYYARLSAYPVDKSRVIAVEFTSSDPALAARVANAIAETYLVTQQRAKQEQTRAAGRWLAGEIEGLRSKVVEAEARAEEYRAKSNLFLGANNTTLSNQQLAELSTQLSAARAQKADMEARARSIRELLRRGAPIEASEVLNSELIRRLGEQRATLRAQLAEQSSTLLDQHPRIKELRAQIVEIDREIKNEAEKIARAFENDSRIAGAREDSLSASLDRLKKQAASSSDQDVRLRSLEREARAQRELLEAYLAKYREASARESLDGTSGDARVISNAVVSNTPSFPKKLPIVLVATFATLFVSSGLVLAGEVLVSAAAAGPAEAVAVEPPGHGTVDPMAEPVRLPPSAPIAAEAREPAPPAQVDETPPLAPAALGSDEPGRGSVLVIAAGGDVATEPVALSLARRLGEGRRVLLVGCAPGAATRSAAGLAEVIAGEQSIASVIVRDPASGIHLVCAGRSARSWEEVWSSDRFAAIIEALARAYDVLVVDAGTPSPMLAARLARQAARALIVTAGAERTAIARERLRAAGFADIGEIGPRPARASATNAA